MKGTTWLALCRLALLSLSYLGVILLQQYLLSYPAAAKQSSPMHDVYVYMYMYI